MQKLLRFALASAVLALPACKPDKPSCNPDDENFKTFRLVVQPEMINVDDEGNPRATVLHVFQLKGGRTLDAMDFDSILGDSKSFFGDELLGDKELNVYPERAEVIEIEAIPEATHVVAVGLFREPTGNTWYREWDVPQYHGYSVCGAKSQGKVWSDPCFYLTIEGVDLDGGHTPPPGFDPKNFEGLQCPGKPLMMKPPPPEGKKKKKKKKGKLKDDAAKAQEDAGKAQDGADKAQGGADKAEKAGDAGKKAGEAGDKVPGK